MVTKYSDCSFFLADAKEKNEINLSNMRKWFHADCCTFLEKLKSQRENGLCLGNKRTYANSKVMRKLGFDSVDQEDDNIQQSMESLS